MFMHRVIAQVNKLYGDGCETFLVDKVLRCGVCGDFNVVRSTEERRGSVRVVSNNDSIHFNHFIEESSLIDLPLSGKCFTWFRGDGRSMSRLDKFLLSEDWCMVWPDCVQFALMCGLSDHCHLSLTMDEVNLGPKPFRMLKSWSELPGVACESRKELDGRLKEVKEKRQVLESKGESEELFESERKELLFLSSQVFFLSRMSCINQWQKSRLTWLKNGDANSKFFHGVMASKRRCNALLSVLVDGEAVEGVAGIREAVFHHFENHFRSVNIVRLQIDNLQFSSISASEAYYLERPFDEVEGDLMRFLLEFYANGILVKGSNCTFIVLIPKVANPQRISNFRPISLVGCMYKILAKVLANRLKLVMDTVISESQFAFVKGRQIMDGILIANEVVDDAKKLKKELTLFKVDFEKTYDSVEWEYLNSVMAKMGFSVKLRQWIITCVSTAIASVLVNSRPTEEFCMGRGLRQWDPLSPFLSLIADEGLNVMLNASVDTGLFKGYQIGNEDRDVVTVSHLQFADDTLILGERSWAYIRMLKANLIFVELISGLKTDGQSERTIQSLEDLLRACVLDRGLDWDSCLSLIEFTYNNSFHSSIGMTPFEALYVRRCRTPLCWYESRENVVLGPEIVHETTEKIRMIREKMKASQSLGRALKSRKLTSRFIGPYQISERVGKVAYRIALPPSLANLHDVFHVSQLRKYVKDLSHVIESDDIQVRDDLTVETIPLRIEGRETKKLRNKKIVSVKIIWGGPIGENAIWELESKMKSSYPELFSDAVYVLNCKIGRIPFIYLGLPIGSNARLHSFWAPLVEKIRDVSVADMRRLGWGPGGNGWAWHRRLFVWEEELLGECCFALNNIVLQESIPNSWVWIADPVTVFTFAWRLMYDRLPTKSNLVLHGCLQNDSSYARQGVEY
ncbi:hypothetical protein TSUD_120920 [Trifolium subterraneum]|uniref:Reverse transcriptase domain-containing protein n=1 Tax=Trifolium subterraneum TaxID=3900 RepID=A0A2Z6MWA5_TRISU|nr:hypothetical protein TSUD_120920 [Trifolium subterraneum]